MAHVSGEATGPVGTKQQLLLDALQQALENAPGPPPGTDIQRFRVVSIELEHGGFVGTTRTVVTLDVEPGPLHPFVESAEFAARQYANDSMVYLAARCPLNQCEHGISLRRLPEHTVPPLHGCFVGMDESSEQGDHYAFARMQFKGAGLVEAVVVRDQRGDQRVDVEHPQFTPNSGESPFPW